jgi:NTP pyrophosphatase (non-canonical NTP hydrolase)
MKYLSIHTLIALFVMVSMDHTDAAEFDVGPPPDEALVRRVEERVELLRKWRVIEAIDPSPELADELFPLLSHHERRDRELHLDRERLTRELRRLLHEDRAEHDHLQEILTALARIRDDRCTLQSQLDDELTRLLTVEQHARLTVVLDDFHREVQELIQRARRRPEGIPGDQLPRPGP